MLVVKNLLSNGGNIRDMGQSLDWEKGTATHSSILAWEIQRTEEPDWLESIGSQRGKHDRSDLTLTHAAGIALPSWD